MGEVVKTEETTIRSWRRLLQELYHFFSWPRHGDRITIKPGKTAVLITGCDSGLGYSFARHCKDSLGLVVIACCLNPTGEGASKLRDDYRTGLHVFKLDLLSPPSIVELEDQVTKLVASENYEIHAVVNNAGLMTMAGFEWLTDELITDMVTVNLLGAMRVTKTMLPLLRATNGRIVNVSSHCSIASMPGLSVYGATKTALEAWANALRMELEKFRVDVVSLIPGSYVGESRILKDMKSSKEIMWGAMSPSKKAIHGDDFRQFYDHLSVIPVPGLAYINDRRLFDKFDGALLSATPKRCYVNAPFRYRAYFFMFSIAPTVKFREFLVKKFVGLPGFQ